MPEAPCSGPERWPRAVAPSGSLEGCGLNQRRARQAGQIRLGCRLKIQPGPNPVANGQKMQKSILLGFALALVLGGCGGGKVAAPGQALLSREVVRIKGDGPPPSPDGECWASSVTPAVIETVTEQVVVAEEVRDETGAVVTPAAFQTQTHQRMVQDREVVWFRAPCPADQTVQFIASLQRALKARGLYLAPVTGVMGAETAEAVRRFQAERGLDSPILSLAAARELGLSATSLDDL